MDEILERIENGSGVLTAEERAALEGYADSTGAPRKIWQVYDETGTDENTAGTVKTGPQHSTRQGAIEWARKAGLAAFSVYAEQRCCTRQRKIWYCPDTSPAHTSW